MQGIHEFSSVAAALAAGFVIEGPVPGGYRAYTIVRTPRGLARAMALVRVAGE